MGRWVFESGRQCRVCEFGRGHVEVGIFLSVSVPVWFLALTSIFIGVVSSGARPQGGLDRMATSSGGGAAERVPLSCSAVVLGPCSGLQPAGKVTLYKQDLFDYNLLTT